MKRVLKVTFMFIFILDICYNTQELNVQTIGIFSECQNTTFGNQGKGNHTELNRIAKFLNRFFGQFNSRLGNFLATKYGSKLIIDSYNFDTCTNDSALLRIVETILLDKKHNFLRAKDNKTFSSVGAIHTYMPETMTKTLKSLIHGIPIYDTNIKGILKDELQFYTKSLTTMFEIFRWRKLLLLSLEPTKYDNYLYRELFHQSINKFKEERFCFHYKVLNETKSLANHNKFNELWLSKEKPVLILFGHYQSQLSFLKQNSELLNSTKQNVIGLELLQYQLDAIAEYIIMVPKLLVITDSYRKFLSFNYPATMAEMKRNNLPKEVRIGVISKFFALYFFYFQRVALFSKSNSIIKSQQVFFKIRREEAHTDVRLARNINFNFPYQKSYNAKSYGKSFQDTLASIGRHKQLGENMCPHLACGPGFQKTYGNVTGGYTWKCEFCPVNHIKPTFGNTHCIPCQGIQSIDNGLRTKCIDPYREVDLEMDFERIFAASLCAIGLIMALLNMSVFTLKKDTPMVRLSDYQLSMAHMTLCGLIFVANLCALLTKPTKNWNCVSRVLLVSVFYVLNIGIVFIKSQKLLQAFLSQVRLTVQEARRTVVIQGFILFLFLILVNGVLGIFAQQEPIKLIEIRDFPTITKQNICNTQRHVNLVTGCAMVLQVLCSIQAFRGRNLPSHMNDGIVLMYTTFTLTIVFSANFAMVHFRKLVDKEVFQFGAVASNTLIVLFLLYGQKAFRILAYPDKNTKAYFREMRMADMKSKANARLNTGTEIQGK
uniref:G-protein coupled receptors family 3 profile domain-containing protein n=2 Tax=Clytia hemisphaerica TaxID=252671 RepID=A0A7M5XG76_9CNID